MKKAIVEKLYKGLYWLQNFIKDIFITFFELTLCESLDIIKLIGFGLLVNGIYGFYKEINLGDFILIVLIRPEEEIFLFLRKDLMEVT
jgi:hypothetical protein